MGMDIKKCKNCGNIFQYMGKNICPTCVEMIDSYFNEIKDYLDEHPNAKMHEIAEELEIDEKFILDFVKSGRIIMKEAVITCVNCGRPIHTGEMCDECKSRLASRIAPSLEHKKREQEEAQKMAKEMKRTGGMHVKEK